jgi:hypothetical protein
MWRGARASLGGAIALATVSTLGDFIWANWIPSHRPVYGLVHGMGLFACVGFYLGAQSGRGRGRVGLLAGAILGGLAAGGFYLLAPVTGHAAMFLIWILVWIAIGLLHRWLQQRAMTAKVMLGRGALAAIGSGIAFFLISGIWRPFNPAGWDYLAHFGGWMVAFLPGFAALLVEKNPPAG